MPFHSSPPPRLFHPLRSKYEFHFGLNKDYQPPGFYIRRGWVGKKNYVWMDCFRPPLASSIRSAYVDALLSLSDVGVLDLGLDLRAKRDRAEKLLAHFRPVAVEVRVDLSHRLAGVVREVLKPYRVGNQYNLVSPDNDRRWDRGYYPNVYVKHGEYRSVQVLRAEMTLLSRSLRDVPLADVLQPTASVLERLWPVVLEKWENLTKGCQPKPAAAALVAAIRSWEPLTLRARQIHLEDKDVEWMIIAGEWKKAI